MWSLHHLSLVQIQPNRISKFSVEMVVHAKTSGVVVTGPFINFLLHNHFITENFFKKKSGDVNDEAKFSLLFFASRES